MTPVSLRTALAATLLCLACLGSAEPIPLERLPRDVLDVVAPSTRVSGSPGKMSFVNRSCRTLDNEGLRPRIVNTAIQEWAYFGFSVDDLTGTEGSNLNYVRGQKPRHRIDAAEAARVADSIAGYWSTTPDSAWILQRQNESWDRNGIGSRWRNPWSAAFISWIMCESGLGESNMFRRAIAHHSYIDQAIMARDDNESGAAYIAYDAGEQEILPGDMLCRGSRPAYRSIAQREDQLGMGARTHCDIVVKVDAENQRFMTIGGNVRGWVRMKLLPANVDNKGRLQPQPYFGRQIFAHLKLQAETIANNALDYSPTMKKLVCTKQPLPHPELLDPKIESCT